MKDICLKFIDEEQAKQSLISFGFQRDESGGLFMPDVCLDVIGAIYTTTKPDAEEPVYTAEPGYHVNLRIINDELDTAPLDEFAVHPVTPARVWA